jgi:hypothetical protein
MAPIMAESPAGSAAERAHRRNGAITHVNPAALGCDFPRARANHVFDNRTQGLN